MKVRSTVHGEGTAGIEFNDFKKKFRTDWGKPLSEFLLQYRFDSIEEMLQAMPEHLRVARKGPDWYLYGVVGEDEDREALAMNTQHIDAGHKNRKKKSRRGRAQTQYFSHPAGNASGFSIRGMRRTMVAPPQVAPRMYGAAQAYHGYQPSQSLRRPSPGLLQPGPSRVPQFHAPTDAGATVGGQVAFPPPPQRSKVQPGSDTTAEAEVRPGSGTATGADPAVTECLRHRPARPVARSLSLFDRVILVDFTAPGSTAFHSAIAAERAGCHPVASPASHLVGADFVHDVKPRGHQRPKIYRFVEILEAHGGKIAMTELCNKYRQKYNEPLAITRALREVLGVQDGWETTVSILSHVDPPIFKSETRNELIVILVPNARGMLDKHTWPNGYSPSQATATASASGTVADFEEHVDEESDRYRESESPADYGTILSGLLGVPAECCSHRDHRYRRLRAVPAERLDIYDRELPKDFPELLAKYCTPVELVQLLKFFFEDTFDVECSKQRGEMVITAQAWHGRGPLAKMDETVNIDAHSRSYLSTFQVENISSILEESSVATLVDPEGIEYGTTKWHQVHITYVDPEDTTNGCVFAVRLADYDDKFEDLCQMLKQYEAVLRVDPEQPADYVVTDGYYLHQSSQGLSRCQVLDLYDDGRVRVDFVDEGRKATVEQGELIDLPRTFWDIPEFAVVGLCTMNTNDKSKLSTLRAKLNELTETSERLSVYAQFLKEDDEPFKDLATLQTRLLVSHSDEPHKEPLVLPDVFN
ncbi:hypothetical protein AAVH_05747 [Aphelenchoides avenae]|nr:hypothetical protein AAVH_05747 [Aphelenchus avenae]